MMINGVRFKGYKSFSPNVYSDINNIKFVNVFIGKNNSGKSSALDIIQNVYDPEFANIRANKPEALSCCLAIDDQALATAYKNVYRNYNYLSVYEQTKYYVGHPIWFEITRTTDYNGRHKIEGKFDEENNTSIDCTCTDWKDYFRYAIKQDYTFAKISAERNIVPESESFKEYLSPNGEGATNLIRKVLTFNNYDEKLIERDLLQALNRIMGTDASFESIRVQEHSVPKDSTAAPLWEVYLQEKESGRYPLSRTGSGLKTIILVLLNLIVLKNLHPNSPYVFGFEELENNLHPALQRRLFEYIYDYAVENKIYVFLTTHSHVAINLFFNKEQASVYHVVKDQQASSIKQVDNYLHRIEILDDLDVKASDLLQANGVIWVEGPSDRIYIKRWLEVFCGDEVIEGKDFQFAYYGGRLLSHYTTDSDKQNLLNMLLINRNSAIVMDSDKRSRNDPINETKKRIQKEFEGKHLFSWITKGKEIENYLVASSIATAFKTSIDQQCAQYKLFPEYIEEYFKRFASRKVEFANQVKEFIDNTNIYDLEEKITKLYKTIKKWNS